MKGYMIKYTLVQHSGYTFGGKEGFANGVEEGSITSPVDEQRVRNCGGLVFDSYTKCAERCEEENYPDGAKGLYPQVKGRFARVKLNSQPVYIPPTVQPE